MYKVIGEMSCSIVLQSVITHVSLIKDEMVFEFLSVS